MDNRPIGIFDSGVGGLSVLLEAQKLLPKEAFVYLADQAYVPYGGKSKEELVSRVTKIIGFFEECNVKAVVAACNTATVYTIDEMRKKFDIPIIGTVPVVKTLADITKTKKTAVFSTPATAKSEYLSDLIEKFADGVMVYKIGGTGLEELVEEGKLEDPKTNKILQESLVPLLKKNVDAIALGCTHYPFLRKKIQEIAGLKVSVVDSGGAVARRLKFVLKQNNIFGSIRSEDFYFTTGEAEKFKKVAEKLLNYKINNVYKITI